MKLYLINPKEILETNFVPDIYFRTFNQFAADAEEDKIRKHCRTHSISDADLIFAPINDGCYSLFFKQLRISELIKRTQKPLLVYCIEDKALPMIPGFYPSCNKFWRRLGYAAPAHYRSSHLPRFEFESDDFSSKDLLASFLGSVESHPLRHRILKLPLRNSVLGDPSPLGKFWWQRPLHEQAGVIARYREVTARSKFVLCPRGVVPASIRIYEAMEASAVPVIIADQIELPNGPNWRDFALFVKTRDLAKIPELLEQHESSVDRMGRTARETWEQYFSPQTSFNSFAEWSAELILRGATSKFNFGRPVSLTGSYVHPHYLRQRLSPIKYFVKQRLTRHLE